MSKKVMLFTFEKTFDYEGFKDDYKEDGITTIEHALAHEKFMHGEGHVSPREFLAYQDDDYDAIFQLVEIGDVLEDGSVEVIQPEVGGLVQVTITYARDGYPHKHVYRRTINKNHDEDHQWRDYYQDVSESYVAGVTWQTILDWINVPREDRKYKVEFLEARPHHNMKVVYTAKDPRDQEVQDAGHESA